jgi:acyl carrier protein
MISDLRTLIDEQLFPLDESVTPQADLYSEGLDSMALMQLILLLEQEFGVSIVPEDLDRENFSTLEKMAEFVFKKQS